MSSRYRDNRGTPWDYQHIRRYRGENEPNHGPTIHHVGQERLRRYFRRTAHDVYIMLDGHDLADDHAMWIAFLAGRRICLVLFAEAIWLDLNDPRGMWSVTW